GKPAAAEAGQKLFVRYCASCHGPKAEGTGNVPALTTGAAQRAADGELFWYITNGDTKNGMPSWSFLPEEQRWQVITYVKSLKNAGPKRAAAASPEWSTPDASASSNAPPPRAPFTDYRFEKPGLAHKITLADLPEPFETPSSGNGPKIAPRPEGA